MELILKSSNRESFAKIIDLANKLNVILEKKAIVFKNAARVNIKKGILNFKGSKLSSPFS